MLKHIFTAALLAVASIATANNLTVNFVPVGGTTTVDVYMLVDGANDGLLNYDIVVDGIDDVDGLDSGSIDYVFPKLDYLTDTFQPAGFPESNNLKGPSGSNFWSAGQSQFGAATPVPGLGREEIDIQGAVAVPDNVVQIPFDGVLGSLLGTLDLGVELDVDTLSRVLRGGGTVYSGTADSSGLVDLDSTTVNVVGDVIPEPATALLAGLAAVGFVARRR